ncbi:MAG: hypothetical protein JZU60_02055 [Ilumatobacteraceae bacterium]|jgi:hypothetical protein|nr:hypothetical protein [Ilumatobacteraceae bacterium]
MIAITDLTIEERHTWGKCPVCEVEHGQLCVPMTKEGKPSKLIEYSAGDTHIARLVNAPHTVAINTADN